MSKTRNERIQRRDFILFVILLLLIVCNIFVILYKYVSVKYITEVAPVTEPEVVEPIVPTQSVQVIPIVSEEVLVQQEARLPEFGYDYEYVMRVVAAESRGEPYEGQLAVAQCIRETSERTMMNPEEVVKQVNPNGTRQYAQPVDISVVTESVRDACCDVFVHGVSATDEPIRYFYSTASGFYSAWHENSLEYVTTIDNHRFFK